METGLRYVGGDKTRVSAGEFRRTFAVEFQTNIGALRKKTSSSKKTCKALVAFFNERIATELAHAARLANLAKTGGVASSFSQSLSIVDYKNHEESTLQSALNSLIDFTIQESEFHRAYAEELREKVVVKVQEVRAKLHKDKEEWTNAIETLRRNIALLLEKLRQDQQKLKVINQELIQLKERKRKLMVGIGLDPNEEIALENLPSDLQKLQRQVLEKMRRKQEITNSCELSNTTASQAQERFHGSMKQILRGIEKSEATRIGSLQKALVASSEYYQKQLQMKTALSQIVDKVYGGIDPGKDIQAFISKDSLCSTNEQELRELYLSMGEELGVEPQPAKAKKDADENETERVFQELLRKEMVGLRQLRGKVAQVSGCGQIYPPVPALQHGKIKLHADLSFDDTHSIHLSLYALYLFSYIVRSHHQTPVSPFRTTQGEESTPDFKEGEGKAISLVIALLMKGWGILESESEAVIEITDTFLGYSLMKSVNLQTNGLHTFCVLLCQRWQGMGARDETLSETELKLQRGVFGLIWAYIFWQVYARAQYREDDFEVECSSLVQPLEFNSYMAEATILNSKLFLDYTLKCLNELGKSGRKYQLRLATPYSTTLFNEYVSRLLFGEEEEFLVLSEIDTVMEEAAPLLESLSIPPDWAYVFLMRSVSIRCLKAEPGEYATKSEILHKSLKCLSNLSRHVQGNSAGIFAWCRLKSADCYLSVSPGTGKRGRGRSETELQWNDQAINEKTERTTILHPLIQHIEENLSSYKDNFGKCRNKLGMLMELGHTAYLLTHGLIDDPTYDQYLSELVETNGKRIVNQLLETYKRPLAVDSAVSGIVREFLSDLHYHAQCYFPAFSKHVGHPEHFYSKPMREILIKDLQLELGKLHIDANPGLFAETTRLLSRFDRICGCEGESGTLQVLLPIAESFLGQKQQTVLDHQSKLLMLEKWTTGIYNEDDPQINNRSAVEICYQLCYVLSALQHQIGLSSLHSYSSLIQKFVLEVAQRFCGEIQKYCGSDRLFLPRAIPGLSLASRKKLIGRAARKCREEVGAVSRVFNHKWAAYLESSSDDLSKICCRFANLGYFETQLPLIIQTFCRPPQIYADTLKSLDSTIVRLCEYLAHKLVYIDLGTAVFSKLYIGTGAKSNTLGKGLLNCIDALKVLRKRVPSKCLKRVLEVLFQELVSAWLHYLLYLLTYSRAEEVRDLGALVREDIQQLTDLFCAKDPKSDFKGISLEFASAQLRSMELFCSYLSSDDPTLISHYRGMSSGDPRRDLITRILFGRNTKEVDRFFDLYKSILTV